MKHIYGRKDSKKVYELKISNLEKSRLIKTGLHYAAKIKQAKKQTYYFQRRAKKMRNQINYTKVNIETNTNDLP